MRQFRNQILSLFFVIGVVQVVSPDMRLALSATTKNQVYVGTVGMPVDSQTIGSTTIKEYTGTLPGGTAENPGTIIKDAPIPTPPTYGEPVSASPGSVTKEQGVPPATNVAPDTTPADNAAGAKVNVEPVVKPEGSASDGPVLKPTPGNSSEKPALGDKVTAKLKMHQDPPRVAKDGKTPVTIIVEVPPEITEVPNVALQSAELVSITMVESPHAWRITALPNAKSEASSIIILNGADVVNIPVVFSEGE